MKKTIKLLCTWAAGLLLAGCSSEADMSKLMDWQSNPDAVHFTASVNNVTTRTNPAATDDAQTKFNENDQVTVSNNGNQADYAYNGESWAPAITDKYLLWDRSNLTFNCWYPAGGNNTATIGYLTADQTSSAQMAKSDYMNATTVLQSADEALNFNLERKTARLILKISGLTDVSGTIKHVRIVSKASTAAGEANTIDITPLTQNGEGEIGGIGTTYTALVIPGEVVAKFYFTDNTSSEEPLTMTTNVTAAGNSYIYNLNVIKRTKIEVTGITAGPWTANGTTTGDLVAGIPYVTFNADANQELMIAQVENISNLQYSVNFGKWTDVKSDGYMWSVEFGGEKGCLRLRCKKNFQGTAYDYKNYAQISFNESAEVACTGDIRTLLDYENYETVQTSGAKFCSLFKDCTQLTSAPDLPATELYDYCYNSMFKGCKSLEKAPALPATTLKQSCYSGMFQGCTSLKEAPTLHAKKMAPSAYRGMFNGCTSLVTAPALPATQIAEECYSYMFHGCTSLKTAPVLSATTLAEYCYSSMFEDCTSLKTAPDLPAVAATACCYYSMFSGCSNLETAPKLSAKSLDRQSYSNMFQNCTSLKTAPVLPATSLDLFCYGSMFSGCTSLQKAPDLPATELAESCYNSMFSGCTSLTTAPKLPAKELYPRCYLGMFKECTSLTTAPDLLVTKLEPGFYKEMFYGCKKLKSVKMLAPSHNKMNDYFTDWLTDAGTKVTTGRTLILTDQTAYDALKTNNLLPANYWQAGKCTVKAADGTVIK